MSAEEVSTHLANSQDREKHHHYWGQICPSSMLTLPVDLASFGGIANYFFFKLHRTPFSWRLKGTPQSEQPWARVYRELTAHSRDDHFTAKGVLYIMKLYKIQ